jgi:tRNA-intron endonuclease
MPKRKAKEPAETADEVAAMDALDMAPVEEVKLPKNQNESDSADKKSKVVVSSVLARENVVTESSDPAREFFNQSRFGTMLEGGKVQLSLLEAMYLLEKGKLSVSDSKCKHIDQEEFMKKARKVEPNIWVRYGVFKDLRNRGYIVKTALKFGADFRVYDRGVKPGEDHAKWIVYPVHEGEALTWYEFSAKNRVAHSTKKRLLIGVVDDESDVTYYEIRWVRP